MSSFETIMHEITPMPSVGCTAIPELEETKLEHKEIKLEWQPTPSQKPLESQTPPTPVLQAVNMVEASMPQELVALQCFGAGVVLGMLFCYFLRGNQE
jgi:hypothetical protein